MAQQEAVLVQIAGWLSEMGKGEYSMEDIRTMYSSVKVRRKQEEKERIALKALWFYENGASEKSGALLAFM